MSWGLRWSPVRSIPSLGFIEMGAATPVRKIWGCTWSVSKPPPSFWSSLAPSAMTSARRFPSMSFQVSDRGTAGACVCRDGNRHLKPEGRRRCILRPLTFRLWNLSTLSSFNSIACNQATVSPKTARTLPSGHIAERRKHAKMRQFEATRAHVSLLAEVTWRRSLAVE